MNKIVLALVALLLALVLYGSMALRRTFGEMRTRHSTTNSIIDQASR